MKRLVVVAWLTTFALCATSSCASNTVTGSKTYITKTIENVEAFKQLVVLNSITVIFTQTDNVAPRIEIYGSDNIVPLIETIVTDQTLTVSFKKNTVIQNTGKIEVRVFAPAIDDVKLRGSGDVNLSNVSTPSLNLTVYGSGDITGKKLLCKELNLSVYGSGDITLSNLDLDELKAAVTGSGDVTINGTAVNAHYSVKGSGDISASKVIAENVQAYINGSGDISCHAEKTLSGKVNGSGDVRYKGTPQTSFTKKGFSKLH